MRTDSNGYVVAYESHHVAYLKNFSDFGQAAAFLHSWNGDFHTWPVCVYNTESNHLWLWCGYRTLDISRDSALADARGFLRLPTDHQFEKVEFVPEDV